MTVKSLWPLLGTDGIDGNTKYAGAIIENFKVDS